LENFADDFAAKKVYKRVALCAPTMTREAPRVAATLTTPNARELTIVSASLGFD
jgi:hypothetical protein